MKHKRQKVKHKCAYPHHVTIKPKERIAAQLVPIKI